MVWLSLLIVGILGTYATSISYIPLSWSDPEICKNLSSVNSLPQDPHTSVLVDLRCHIPYSDKFHWRLNDLRTISNRINYQTTPKNRTVIYNITVTCEDGANISLPWPMRVAGLKELHVSYCRLVDKYNNVNDTSTADDLRILELRHSVWLLNDTNLLFDGTRGSLNLSSTFDCGQQTSLEISIMSNISGILITGPDVTSLDAEILNNKALTEFTGSTQNPSSEFSDVPSSKWTVKPEDRLMKDTGKVVSNHTNVETESADINKLKENIAKEAAQIEHLKLKKMLINAHTKCKFEKLKLIDESLASLTSTHHFDFMVQEADYPVLEYMNYSYIGLTEFPKQLSQWRIYFPALKQLVVSHNLISEVNITPYPSPLKDIVRFDLRYNNITSINMDILKSWAKVPSFFIDIRDNPIHCGCEMSNFLRDLKNETIFTGSLEPYRYVTELYCKTPELLAGKQLRTLTEDSLSCPDHSPDKTAIIVLAIFMAILIIIIIIIIKFKVEIRILLYTRLHIRLPCDAEAHRNNKIYDAFISYSNEDTKWVHENLIAFLEKSPTTSFSDECNTDNKNKNVKTDNRFKTFKLCVHQRDFIAGKSIFDNIVDSIEASRHTIIVLSPSFMRSHWAMEELRQAYRQSLVEKTRHLIVILLEKVTKDDMDPLIRRCCKTFTYLEVDDILFRDRLVFSLTTKDRGARRRDRLEAKERKMSQTCRQLDESTIYEAIDETGAHDNLSFSSSSGRPTEPIRELSNMSTSSSTTLAPF